MRGVKVATNAGGVNPSGCKRALEDIISGLGLSLTVAMVEGDDVMPLIDKLRAEDCAKPFRVKGCRRAC